MARVTVEDCVTKVPNRFELVMLAAQRARQVSAGAPLTVDRDNDKNPVVALREIADETVNLDELEQAVITGLQKNVQMEEPEDEMELLSVPDTGAFAETAGDGGAAAGGDALTVDGGSAPATMGQDIIFEDADVSPED